jgi:hypothetical protein
MAILLYQFFIPKVNNNINNHQPSSLPPGAEETMDEMVGEFEVRLRSECGD